MALFTTSIQTKKLTLNNIVMDKMLTQTTKYSIKFSDGVDNYIKVGTTKSRDKKGVLIESYVMLSEEEFKNINELDFNINKNNYFKLPVKLADENVIFTDDDGIVYVDFSKIE